MDLISILDDMITSGLGLALVAGAYAVWWLSGFIPNLFSPKKWSWIRGLEDFCKAFLMGLVVVATVGLLGLGGQFFAMLGWDITKGTEAFSTFALIGAMSTGFVYYLGKAAMNAWKFLKLVKSDSEGDLTQFEKGKAEVGKAVREFLETITTKTDREHMLEEAASTSNLFNDVAIAVADAGKGGIVNTYPEPYRSAAQDSMTDPSSCYNRECVSYCAWKVKEATGAWPKRTGSMNAKYWVERLAENGYSTVVKAPQAGGLYVGVTPVGPYGHVVWYEGGQTISEYNYATRGAFSVRMIDLSAYTWVQIKAPTTPAIPTTAVPDKAPAKKDGTVTYTYKAGDTFGQVISDLGLTTAHGLWGDDGDVAYYTNQLHAQGIWGNIPISQVIKLTPRK